MRSSARVDVARVLTLSLRAGPDAERLLGQADDHQVGSLDWVLLRLSRGLSEAIAGTYSGHGRDPGEPRRLRETMPMQALLAKRTTGVEPATFGLGSRRSTN
jgi:hypothetical protein